MGYERVINVDSAGNVRSVEDARAHEARERLKRLAWFLDSSIPIPGTGFTIGVDALIGLFPFLGDLIGVLLSTYIVGEAARMGAPKSVLGRMAANVAVEGVVGIVPFAGDLFDAVFKANQRNVRLLDQWLEAPRKTERSSKALAVAIILGIALVLVGLTALGVLLAQWIISLF
jgi:NADH:ubiquinone oxidoreductase subunit 5 (subunit L)/multisubunit Na+/H+ antiporter MnhA subunit